MKKVAIVYWSGTGNTEEMARLVGQGAETAGAETQMMTSAQFGVDQLDQWDAVAFGCPSMGDEQLEESEFEPMFSACLPGLKDKKIGLFGSYGWGDGAWMRSWEEDCRAAGANLVGPGVICEQAPDEEASEACRQLGGTLAG